MPDMYKCVSIFIVLLITTIVQAQDFPASNWAALSTSNASELELLDIIDANAFLETAFLHIRMADVSADGQYMALYLAGYENSSVAENELIVLDMYNKLLVSRLSTNVTKLVISGDGQWLAFTSESKTGEIQFTLYDVRNQITVLSEELSTNSFEFSPNNRRLAFLHYEGATDEILVSNWSLDRQELTGEYRFTAMPSLFGSISSLVSFSPDSSLLAITNVNKLYLYNTETEASVLEMDLPLNGDPYHIFVSAFLSDSKTLILGQADGGIYVIDTERAEVEYIADAGFHDTLAYQIRHYHTRNVYALTSDGETALIDLATMDTLSTVSAAALLDTSSDSQLGLVQIEMGDFSHLQIISLGTGETLADILDSESQGVDAFISPAMNYVAVIRSTGIISIYGINQ